MTIFGNSLAGLIKAGKVARMQRGKVHIFPDCGSPFSLTGPYRPISLCGIGADRGGRHNFCGSLVTSDCFLPEASEVCKKCAKTAGVEL